MIQQIKAIMTFQKYNTPFFPSNMDVIKIANDRTMVL